MIKNNFLICLVGLPASGKTTFANKIKTIIEKGFNNFKVKIIDPDLIRESLNPDKFDYKMEQKVRKKNLKAIKNALEDGYIVISDDLNYYSSMRNDLKKISENLDKDFFIIHIATPLETCIKWNIKRGLPISNELIQNINEKFDNFDRYSWDMPIIKFDFTNIKDLNQEAENLLDLIDNTFVDKEKSAINDYNNYESSNIDNENLDKYTRKYVGNLLQNPNFQYLKKELLQYRKVFIKKYLAKSLDKSKILKEFKEFLEIKLDIKIRL